MVIYFCLQIEPELGLSERFYHIAVSSFFIGEFLGALIAGILSSKVPFWYSAMGALLFHTVGFVIYATAVNGWMIIVARILTGFFAGLQVVTILAYFGVSYQHYLDVIGTKERKKEEAKATRLKDQLFAFYMVTANAGILFGPGLILCMHMMLATAGPYNLVYHCKNTWVTSITFLGCLSCVSVTKECYPISFLEGSFRTLASLFFQKTYIPGIHMQPRNYPVADV